jgi:hypothetical protein
MYFHFVFVCRRFYASTRLMNEVPASRGGRAMSPSYIVVYLQLYLYAGWLELNVSYVGLVMCRRQRPLFDLAAVRNPASWLARVDAGDCLHMENV